MHSAPWTNFQFHLRHLHADPRSRQRQLAGEDGTGQAHLMPELHRGPVDRALACTERWIGAAGEGFGISMRSGIGHDECIRPHSPRGACRGCPVWL